MRLVTAAMIVGGICAALVMALPVFLVLSFVIGMMRAFG